jgi:hypothetical protein
MIKKILIRPDEPKIFSLIGEPLDSRQQRCSDAPDPTEIREKEKERRREGGREIDAQVNQVLFTNPPRNLNQTRFAPKARRADGDNGDEKTRRRGRAEGPGNTRRTGERDANCHD